MKSHTQAGCFDGSGTGVQGAVRTDHGPGGGPGTINYRTRTGAVDPRAKKSPPRWRAQCAE